MSSEGCIQLNRIYILSSTQKCANIKNMKYNIKEVVNMLTMYESAYSFVQICNNNMYLNKYINLPHL